MKVLLVAVAVAATGVVVFQPASYAPYAIVVLGLLGFAILVVADGMDGE